MKKYILDRKYGIGLIFGGIFMLMSVHFLIYGLYIWHDHLTALGGLVLLALAWKFSGFAFEMQDNFWYHRQFLKTGDDFEGRYIEQKSCENYAKIKKNKL